MLSLILWKRITFNVYTILYIFYRFTKDAVIHQLKEVFLKVVFRFRSQLDVEIVYSSGTGADASSCPITQFQFEASDV